LIPAEDVESPSARTGKLLKLRDDFYAITYLGHIKETASKYEVTEYDRSNCFRSSVFIFGMQVVLVTLISKDLLHQGLTHSFTQADYSVMIVRVVCAIILHIQLQDEIRQSIALLKHLYHNYDTFTEHVAPCLIALMQFTVGIYTELINIFVICQSNDTMTCMMNFVVLAIIANIDDYYAAARSEFALRAAIRDEITTYKGGEKGEEGGSLFSLRNLVVFPLFKVLKGFFVAFYFYFFFFLALVLSYLASKPLPPL